MKLDIGSKISMDLKGASSCRLKANGYRENTDPKKLNDDPENTGPITQILS